MSKKSDKPIPTLSEQYDQKLRAELYVSMLKLQEQVMEMEYAEDHYDADKMSDILMNLHKSVPTAVTAYFKCIEGDRHV